MVPPSRSGGFERRSRDRSLARRRSRLRSRRRQQRGRPRTAGVGGLVSLRDFEEQTHNETLGLLQLRQRGDTLFDVDRDGDEQVWLDLAAQEGRAWLVHRDGVEVLRLIQYVGSTDVAVPGGVFPDCRHYTIRTLSAGTYESDHGAGQEASGVEEVHLYLAPGVGPVKVTTPRGEYRRSSLGSYSPP